MPQESIIWWLTGVRDEIDVPQESIIWWLTGVRGEIY